MLLNSQRHWSQHQLKCGRLHHNRSHPRLFAEGRSSSFRIRIRSGSSVCPFHAIRTSTAGRGLSCDASSETPSTSGAPTTAEYGLPATKCVSYPLSQELHDPNWAGHQDLESRNEKLKGRRYISK